MARPVPDPGSLTLAITVPGDPIPQPRPRFARVGRGVRTYVPANHPVHSYRQTIGLVARQAENRRGIHLRDLETPVSVDVAFCYRACRSGAKTTRPDLDNLVKAVLDGLVWGGTLEDDNAIWEITARKRWVTGPPCTVILLSWRNEC